MPTKPESVTRVLPACVSRIDVFPVKSLDGVSIPAGTLRAAAGFARDRQFAIVDAEGYVVNAKRTAEIHQVRAIYDTDLSRIGVGVEGFDDAPAWFSLDSERAELSAWLSDFFGYAVRLIEDAERGFPDDLECSGPTIVSTQTLDIVAGWFESLNVDDVRRRFRANIELSAPEAFFEERLFRADARPVSFRIGECRLGGIGPCVRCIVPTRSPHTGAPVPTFQSMFERSRDKSMPAFVDRGAFATAYSLTLNTTVVAGGHISCGDALELESA